MQKIFDSVSNVVASKLNNPFTNTFLISWIVFNWKPLLYFLLSKSDVETKICTIYNLYSDICHVVLFPLLSTFIILIGIPKLLVWLESVNKKSNKTRKENATTEDIDDIDRRRRTAEATIQMEQKIKIAQNMGEENKLFEEIQNTLRLREEELSIEKTKYAEKEKAHFEEIKLLNAEISAESNRNAALQGKLSEAINTLNNTEAELKKYYEDLQKEYRDQIDENEKEIYFLQNTLRDREAELSMAEAGQLRKKDIIDILRPRASRLFDIGGNYILETEYYDQMIYYDINNDHYWYVGATPDDYQQLLNNAREVFDNDLINKAIERLRQRNNADFVKRPLN